MPIVITFILESPKVTTYLKKRNLLKQYTKAKNYVLSWDFGIVKFKMREPKSDDIWYFRINQQFRAHAYLEWDTLIVYKIDNHQN